MDKKIYEKPEMVEMAIELSCMIACSSLPEDPSPGDTPWGDE